jgi:hypothetical protein
MFGALYFGSAPWAGITGAPSLLAAASSWLFVASASLTTGAPLAAVSSYTWTGTAATFAAPALAAQSTYTFSSVAILTVPAPYGPGILIGGLEATGRVRRAGLTIRDVLNDAPNTCQFTLEGEPPAVGQAVRITIGPAPSRLLFAGAIQSVDQSYDLRPPVRSWAVTAIDDTGAANARRPFGSWQETAANVIATFNTTTFAPGFSTAGIAPNLPLVTITYDGAETFIAALARLATAIGGYCRIEDHTVYLFLTDLADPPDPIDAAHPPLDRPPVVINTDASQLRTRVYGKGYGEAVQADVAAGETLIPIADGVNFPPLGGSAIAAVTADGAQSERLTFASVELRRGGSLVGTGSSPGNAPSLALVAAGTPGIESGDHEYAVVYVTATGRTLPSPRARITVGALAPPELAPVTGTPVAGTGPDQGSHDYVVAFVTAYGETTPGPVSNYQTTSTAIGQLPTPSAPVTGEPTQGAGVPDGVHDYRVTFVNANGETAMSVQSAGWVAGSKLIGKTDPVTPGGPGGSVPGTTGGALTPGSVYTYFYTYTTARGETTSGGSITAALTSTQNAVNIPLSIHGDSRVTGRKVYRLKGSGSPQQSQLCATISNNTATSHLDVVSDASIAGAPPPPSVDTTADPGTMTPFNVQPISGIQTGPAGTTARRLYRGRGSGNPAHYMFLATINNNTATTYTDTKPDSALGAAGPTSNTSGSAVQQIPITAIPIGPAGVTARRLYRRFNGAGAFYLVTTIANNTGTTFTDTIANSALGAAALATTTAVSNRVAVTFPAGPAAVTSTELYRTPVGSAQLKLWHTEAGHAGGTITDTVPDASLGATAPIDDTSGLQQPDGQVTPGATVLPVASSTPFRAAGGWVELGGGQVVRYGGVSGSTLTGLPATGPGALTTTVLYGSQAIPAPMLVGVATVGQLIRKGSAIHIWVQHDDITAQAEHAARTGGDGIVEYLITDMRRGVDSLSARCVADLALFCRPIVTVAYACRDVKTKSGKPITVTLPGHSIALPLIIQDVTIDQIDVAARLAPRFTVRASSVRFSLEDTLRRLVAAENKGIR